MVVVFEFLSTEPIENLITCLNYKVDKVVYFGYHETIQSLKDSTKMFLKKHCGVGDVVFHPLSHNDLQSILHAMKKEIEHELQAGAKIFFDITGGESLILVAFGMLSRDYDTPIHFYDIPKNRLIELDEGAKLSLSETAQPKPVKLDLDQYIEMRGGIINKKLQKSIKEKFTEEFVEDTAALWEVARRYGDYWNLFSAFLRAHMVPNESLQVSKDAKTIRDALSSFGNMLDKPDELHPLLDALAEKGLLLDLKHDEQEYRFRFKNQAIKDCIWEGGSILELHTFQQERNVSDDCRVGVHIDWDGVIHSRYGEDVYNEIDVLTLTGVVPTFISCKSGKMGPQQSLHALYELDSIARRFGGKYARKKLVTFQPLGDVYKERAKEMGIEVE